MEKNIIDPVDAVKCLADAIGLDQLYTIVNDMRGSDTLKKKLEAKELYIKQLENENEYNKGLINGLWFAFRCCNGIDAVV